LAVIMRNRGKGRRSRKIAFGKDLPVSPEELVALRQAVGWPAKGDYRQILEDYTFYISARLNGRLVGFLPVVGSSRGDLLIHSMCVHPDLQKRGIGKRLMQEALEACRQLNPQGVNVLFEESNRAFFERFGFRVMCGGYLDARSLKKTKRDQKK
jgi:N-acetylglutamate synthase-like GNAT family acetyltransferase